MGDEGRGAGGGVRQREGAKEGGEWAEREEGGR